MERFRTLAGLVSRALARGIAALFGARAALDPLDVLRPETRIVEVGPADLRLAHFLARHGRPRYLAVAEDAARVHALRERTDDAALRPRVVATPNPAEITKNNAEVLVLSGRHARVLWSYADYAHARLVAWAPRLDWSGAVAVLGLAKNVALRRIAVMGVAPLHDPAGPRRALLVVRTLKPARTTARRYLSPVTGVAVFFDRLESLGVRYAVLRWFERLPELEPGEDIDLLVEDAAVGLVQQILDEEPGTIACDLYSVSGLPGTASRNMAYYPPPLARRILERATHTAAGIRAPEPLDHLLSMAYHAVYHKGTRSGIPTAAGTADFAGPPEHDYAAVLARLAAACGRTLELTLEGLDDFLAEAGWRPPHDMLVRLSASNPWLRSLLPAETDADAEPLVGLAVFFIRQRALELGVRDRIVERLREEGFTILHQQTLLPEESRRVAALVRGGNWGKGPWQVSGGGPAVVVVAHDLIPVPPGPAVTEIHPTLDNRRILVKQKLRDELNTSLEPSQRCNLIHSSDNAREALHYLKTALPDHVERIVSEVHALRSRFDSGEAVRRTLTHRGRRAKVEVIEYANGLAVKKTFRPGFERFAAREAHAMKTFGGVRPEIPPLLEAGENYVVYPYYPDTIEFEHGSMVPLWVARQALDLMRFFWEHGYSMIDLQPSNILIDRNAGLKIIDFEFFHRYAVRPETFEECYELAGLPDDFDGDRPRWGISRHGGYNAEWQPYVGLELHSLLHDPAWLQHLKRTRYRLSRLPRKSLRATRRAASRGFASLSNHVRQAVSTGGNRSGLIERVIR